jgi:site-specific DNA recombinase
MDVFIYARQSKYRDGGLSPNCETQVEECKEWADETGHRIAGIFKDVDISASEYSSKPRLDYDRMLDALRRNQADGVVSTEMSRLYRRLEEILELIHLATETRMRHIKTTDNNGYDLSTGEGIHNAVSAVNNSVLESRRMSDRIKRKKRAQAKKGQYHGGPRPFGYEGPIRDEYGNVTNRNRIGVAMIEEEAVIIREVVDSLIDGASLRSIVRDLNYRGIRTSAGKPWQVTTMRRMLSSKRIIGIRSHQGMDYSAQWPAIISREQWDKVQVILRSEDIAAEHKGVRTRRYLLTGFLECGLCGAKMVGRGRIRRNDGTQHERYSCPKYDTRGIQVGCGRVVRLAEPIDRLVTESVLYRYDAPELMKALSEVDSGGEVQGLLNEYHAQKLKMEDLVRDYATGLLNREQLARAKSIVDEALQQTQDRLTKIQTGRAFASIPIGMSVRDAWESADSDWRRSLLDLIVKSVIVNPGRCGSMRWKDESGGEWNFDPSKIAIVWKV